MISRDLVLKISNNKASLSEPVTVYMYDRGILLNIKVIEYKYKTSIVEQENIIESDGIVYASALIKSPDNKIFKYPDVKAIISDDIVKILITKEWTNDTDVCGNYQIQIQLYDMENSRISLPPFSITVSELVAPYDDGDLGDTSGIVDISEFNSAYIGVDVKVHDNSDIVRGYYDKTNWIKGMNMSTGHFNKIEEKLEELYSGEGLYKTNIPELNTTSKTTIGAINELTIMYETMHKKINDLIEDKLSGEIQEIHILNENPIEKLLGETFKINYNVIPDSANKYDVTFHSDNEFVCKVSEFGTVQVNGTGNCTITCKSKKNENIYDEINIICTTKQIAIESINIGPEEILMDPTKDTYQFNCIISPEDCTQKSVTWTTSNPFVCAVDNSGKLTKLLQGDRLIGPEFNGFDFNNIMAACNIMCISDSNSSVYDYCRVLFGQTPTAINISGEIPNDLSVGDTIQLKVDSVLPDNIYPGYDKFEWESSDENIANIDENGMVTITCEGSCEIYARSVYDPSVISNKLEISVPENPRVIRFKTIDNSSEGQFNINSTSNSTNADKIIIVAEECTLIGDVWRYEHDYDITSLSFKNVSSWNSDLPKLKEIVYCDFSEIKNFSCYKCINLEKIPYMNFEDNCTLYNAFESTSLNDIPGGRYELVTDISSAFKECDDFVDVIVPSLDNVTVYSGINNIFAGCSKLETVEFENCSQVKSVNNAFKDCIKLKSIKNANFNSVTNFNNFTNNCTSLVYFDSTLNTLDTNKNIATNIIDKSGYEQGTFVVLDSTCYDEELLSMLNQKNWNIVEGQEIINGI